MGAPSTAAVVAIMRPWGHSLVLLLLPALALFLPGLGQPGACATSGTPPPPPGANLDPSSLEKFVDPLPRPAVINGSQGGILVLGMYKAQHRFHRDLPPATVYAFGTSPSTASFPGPTIEALRGTTTRVQWINFLPDQEHMFPVDPTLPRALPLNGGIPTVVHLHGGENPPASDGHPSAWFTAKGETGPAFRSYNSEYPNHQLPAALWYRDAAFGWSRLNRAAGLLGLYVVRDPAGVERRLSLPSGQFEVPLVLADRRFLADGSIDYPSTGVGPTHPVWAPEYITNTTSVNGKLWPYMDVERKAYRLRILDASNSRLFNLSFVCAAPQDYPGLSLPLAGTPLSFLQIGSSGGYLNSPVELKSMLVGIGERYDVIIDFAAAPSSCSDVILVNSAPRPFPFGTPPDSNSGLIMKFHLSGGSAPALRPPKLPQVVTPISPGDVSSVRLLDLSVVTYNNSRFPVEVLIGNRTFLDSASLSPVLGTVERWDLVNSSPVAHSVHLPLVQSQLLLRQPFNASLYLTQRCSLRNALHPTCLTGPAVPPLPEEGGWTDTVKALPGQVTSILLRWSTQVDRGAFPFDATSAPGYTWQCVQAEHTDNDMVQGIGLLQPSYQVQSINDNGVTGVSA